MYIIVVINPAKPFTPKRYYSIDRVFRNEAVDRTHLAEFHQIEGLICDRNLTLGHLIGVLSDFFASLGKAASISYLNHQLLQKRMEKEDLSLDTICLFIILIRCLMIMSFRSQL
ncbi:uncharacterized protein A4U43_C01F16900 [Asparagus officinalis]|uniref:Aminoacyl-transfer RNA synthetases class-II family profile domain-containing protein n=1 Tax=Asparagus officinalis TaxID=4686 RepID=A0A5P1FQ72_ASPOF|nr:uncharacterized protein A4U43_C01F16900 [Asparagus officinalis]